jgi:GrpB-like predicted nucleotidyltransferase (UPF0157 family)
MPTFEESVAAGGRQVGGPRNDPIELADYDPIWPVRFVEYRDRLRQALGPVALRIEHVGSTAVPGLVAKPVIDIQISVRDVENDEAFVGPIESQGFQLRFVEPGHRYFHPRPGLPRLAQVHVCTVESTWERNHLLFRDYLRSHPGVAEEYAALKRELVGKNREDRIAYTDAKGPFIEAVLARAMEDEESTKRGQPPKS